MVDVEHTEVSARRGGTRQVGRDRVASWARNARPAPLSVPVPLANQSFASMSLFSAVRLSRCLLHLSSVALSPVLTCVTCLHHLRHLRSPAPSAPPASSCAICATCVLLRHLRHTQQHSSQQSTHKYLRGECVGAVHSSSPVPPCPQHPYQHPFFLRSPASRGRIPPIPRPLHPTHCGRRARA